MRRPGKRPGYSLAMSLDRVFRLTFRNLSTLFLLVATVSVPLHLGYGIVFWDVVEVRELHDEIENFPPQVAVKGVGPKHLREARAALAGVVAVELGLILLLTRATARIVDVDEDGGVPTVFDAWSHIRSPAGRPGGSGISTFLVALGFSVVVGILAYLLLGSIADFLSGSVFVLAGPLSLAGAIALGAPFALIGWVMGARSAKANRRRVPTLY